MKHGADNVLNSVWKVHTWQKKFCCLFNHLFGRALTITAVFKEFILFKFVLKPCHQKATVMLQNCMLVRQVQSWKRSQLKPKRSVTLTITLTICTEILLTPQTGVSITWRCFLWCNISFGKCSTSLFTGISSVFLKQKVETEQILQPYKHTHTHTHTHTQKQIYKSESVSDFNNNNRQQLFNMPFSDTFCSVLKKTSLKYSTDLHRSFSISLIIIFTA